jgi:hypothetical protein
MPHRYPTFAGAPLIQPAAAFPALPFTLAGFSEANPSAEASAAARFLPGGDRPADLLVVAAADTPRYLPLSSGTAEEPAPPDGSDDRAWPGKVLPEYLDRLFRGGVLLADGLSADAAGPLAVLRADGDDPGRGAAVAAWLQDLGQETDLAPIEGPRAYSPSAVRGRDPSTVLTEEQGLSGLTLAVLVGGTALAAWGQTPAPRCTLSRRPARRPRTE